MIVSCIGEICLDAFPKEIISLCEMRHIHLEGSKSLKKLESFFEATLFNEHFGILMEGPVLLFLKKDYELGHQNLYRVLMQLKLILLEFFYGNPFSSLHDRLFHCYFENTNGIYEYLRSCPSFMQ